MRAPAVMVLILSLASVVRAADDDDTGAWLEWNCADPSCSTPVELAAKVSEHLGAPASDVAARSQSKIRAYVQRLPTPVGTPATWLAEARLLNKDGVVLGTRRISQNGDTCAPAEDALALVTAFLLSNPPDKPQPPPSTEREQEAPPLLPAAIEPPPPHPPRGWTPKLEGGVSAAIGLLPGLSAAGEIRVFALAPSGRSLFARMAYWPESRVTLATGQGSTLQLATVGAGLCPIGVRRGSRSLALCAGGDLGWLRASGFRFASSTTRDLWFIDVTAEAEVEQTIAEGFFATLGLRAIVPLLRTRVAYSSPAGENQVYRPWPVAAAAHLGLGYTFR